MDIDATMARIREVAGPLLEPGETIHDIVYRNIDLGRFGPRGYSLVLCRGSGKILGCSFPDEPTDEQISQAVRDIQRVFNGENPAVRID